LETVNSQFERVFGVRKFTVRKKPTEPYYQGYLEGQFPFHGKGNPYPVGSIAFLGWAMGFADCLEDGSDQYARTGKDTTSMKKR